MAAITALRVIHIGLGIFWAGAVFFMTLFLMPSVAAAGPAGGRVMQELVKRGQLTFFPVIALITILSGVGLMWWDSGGFSGSWFASPRGLALTVGAVAALIAFIVGAAVMRPASLQAGELGPRAQAAEGPERDALMAQVAAASARAGAAGRAIAVLLLVAVVCMALARTI